jgi:hypothetical protein
MPLTDAEYIEWLRSSGRELFDRHDFDTPEGNEEQEALVIPVIWPDAPAYDWNAPNSLEAWSQLHKKVLEVASSRWEGYPPLQAEVTVNV